MSRTAWLIFGLGCATAAGAGAQAAPASGGARLGGLFAEAPHHAAPDGPEQRLIEIERELDALAQRGDAAVAASAIEQGRHAIGAARAAFARGERATGERAQQVAWAALSLASRRIAAADAASAAARAAQREREAIATRELAEQALIAARARLAALRARDPR